VAVPARRDDAVAARPIAPPASERLQAIAASPATTLGGIAAVLVLLATAASGRIGGLDLLFPVGIVLLAALSYTTGANSVSESVATLVGGGLSGYRAALIWGSIWTLAGALTATALASALVTTIASDLLARSRLPETMVVGVIAGTLLWMFIATHTGMPVAATHAITGSLVVVGALTFGVNAVRWSTVLDKVGLPVAISPLLAVVAALLIFAIVSRLGTVLRDGVLTGLHWFSSAAASFARGLNEAPKLVALGALLLAARTPASGHTAPFVLFALVGGCLLLGSVIAGRKVTETLAERVTDMDHVEAFSANAVTAVLVGVSTNLGLPVSTAEVGSGAISGVGLHNGVGTVNWSVLRSMALAWVVTAPAAGLCSLIAFWALRLVYGG
jgi:inorganic phosphate transporter, PiT family